MLSEIKRRTVDPLVSGDPRLILERADDVESHLNLGQTSVNMVRGAIRVKPRPNRDKMVLGRPDGPLRSVWDLHEWGN